jgi:DNA-binding transcriptional regulator YdaS (Cro superfamily)
MPEKPSYRRRPPPSRTALALYLHANGITPYQFAQLVGRSPWQVGNWCRGQYLPSLVSAFRIERATKGAVPVASWLGTEIGRREWGAEFDWDTWKQDKNDNARKSHERRARGESPKRPSYYTPKNKPQSGQTRGEGL